MYLQYLGCLIIWVLVVSSGSCHCVWRFPPCLTRLMPIIIGPISFLTFFLLKHILKLFEHILELFSKLFRILSEHILCPLSGLSWKTEICRTKELRSSALADAKSTPSYYLDLPFSVLHYRSNRGTLICSKICSKKLYNTDKM